MNTWIIGITGGVGSGKSEILKYLESKCDCKIMLSDMVAKDMYKPGSACFNSLIDLLGMEVLDGNGLIQPGLMAEKIFSDQELLQKINEIVHPAVIQTIVDQIDLDRKENKLEFFFVESALLIEAGFEQICDELWYIYAEHMVRRQRLKDSRHYSDEKIDQIISSQLPEQVFREKCKVIIDNSGNLEESKKQIDTVLEAHRCQK